MGLFLVTVGGVEVNFCSEGLVSSRRAQALLCSSLSPLFLDCNFLSSHRNFALFCLAIKLCSSCCCFKEEKEKL